MNTHELNDGMSRITSQWKVFLCAALPFDYHVICSGVLIGQQLTNPLLPSRCNVMLQQYSQLIYRLQCVLV